MTNRYILSEVKFYQQLNDYRDTAVSILRTVKDDSGESSNHHRVFCDCLTFAQNPNYLHEQLIKLENSLIDLKNETDFQANLDALKDELINKDWVLDSQLLTDYMDWLKSQNTI